MTAWLSSKGIPHHDLLPHISSGHLPAVNSRPPPGIAFPSLCASSQLLHIPGDLGPCPGYIGLQQGLSVCFSLHSDCHRAAAVLSNSLECFSAVPNSNPDMGSDPCFGFSAAQGQVQSCSPSLLFFPSSLVLPSFAWIYIFLSGGQGLLPALSWCSARSSASKGIFLMHPQRERYSTSTYTCAILSSLGQVF